MTKEEKVKEKSQSLIIEETKRELQAYLQKNGGKVSHKSFYVKLDKLARTIESSEHLSDGVYDEYIDIVDSGLKYLEGVYAGDRKTIKKKKDLYEY